MASGRKTTKGQTGKRKTTTRTATTRSRSGQRKRADLRNAEETSGNTRKSTASSELKNEIILMVALVVSVLLLLSHFNLGGAVGAVTNSVMFGLFGLVAYLFPVILFFLNPEIKFLRTEKFFLQ